MSSRFSKKFPIPEKFPEILHDFAREVVRYNPKDILDFSIQYFYYIENNLPLNYTLGGSSNIPKSLYENIEKEKSNRENLTTPISVGKTNISTANQFYSHQENENEKNNRKESAQKSVTAIEIEKQKEINEETEEEKKSTDKNLPLTNEMKNLIGLDRPLTTFSGISGTDSVKKGIRDFTNELIGNCKESVKSNSNMYNNSSQSKDNKKNEEQVLSTFSGISGTESQKNDVRAFINELVIDSKEEATKKLENKI